MHPLLRSRALLIAYLCGWALFSAVFLFSARMEGAPWREGLLLAGIAAGLGAALFPWDYYACKALPLRTTPPLILGTGWLGGSLVMGGLWSGLLILAARPLHLLPESYVSWQGWVNFAITGAFMYLATVAMHYVIIAHQQSEESQRTEQELRVLAREAELKALRAQLNPHFLFNSLNSISALTTLDPKRAREMCVLLSDFFRKSLKLGERIMVPLSEEVDLSKAYLAIEQIRFGPRLTVDWDIDPAAEGACVPALLLQPLVENAIKHGIAQLPEGGTLKVAAFLRAGLVEIRIENARDLEQETAEGLGLGLQQVKQRLRGCYGTEAFFEAGPVEATFRVTMGIPPVAPSGECHHE